MNPKDLKIKVGDHLRLRFKNESFLSKAEHVYMDVECMAYRGRKKYYYAEDRGRDYVLSDSEVKRRLVNDDNELIFPELNKKK